ncbi:MAG: type II secretion system GspH family protein [Phycisphaerales bacterium]|nr:type II secretion system GspH family protein [Phycisphaerales bacterium]
MNIAAGNRQSPRRAFTLVEVLVAIVVIGVLMALLITGLNAAGVFARKSADQQTLNSIATATTQFETTFDFLPPLVYDGAEMGAGSATSRGAFSNTGPVYTAGSRRLVNVYKMGDANARAFLMGSAVSAATPYRDARYSKFSIPIYLMGSMPVDVDGVQGLGMVAPARDGSWAGVGDAMTVGSQQFEPFMEGGRTSARLSPNYFDPAEQSELGGGSVTDRSNRDALVDRNGKAFRYYRWLHEDSVQRPGDLNIPAALIDPLILQSSLGDPTLDVTDGNAELRGATWALLGAGSDGLFGTEDIATLRDRLKAPSDMPEGLVRQKAMQDNLVRVGR